MKKFLAIDIPDETKQEIENQIMSFKEDYMYIVWNDPSQYHIPLYIFEDYEITESLHKKIEEAIFEIRPFMLYASGVDLYQTNKIELFMDFHKERMLSALVKSIHTAMQNFKTREMQANIILGQYKLPSKQQYLLIRKKLQNLEIDISFPVNKIFLKETVTGGKKPVYKNLAEFTLHE